LKLLDKYSRLNITATILTFIIGSCTFYFLLNYILIRELDERLQAEQQEILAYVNTHKSLPDIVRTKDQFTLYEQAVAKVNTEFTTVKLKQNNEQEDYREIKFSLLARDKYYQVTVGTPLDETEALLQVIICVTIAMIGIILLIGFLINRIVIRRLWKPFYSTIESVKNYHLSEQQTLKLERTDIDEFSLLNQSINEMVDRIQQDYGSLKNFTGQAAHEMQTPLAVIRTKLDTLMQNEAVLEKNAQLITDIEKAVHRLSRLHQSLLLLTKVENKQFLLNEKINLDKIVTDKYEEFGEMASAMNLSIKLHIEPVVLLFHQQLAEIIISNLLNNAIRYNRPSGEIEISLNDTLLTVSNTSDKGKLDSTKLFKRFYRDADSSEGTGLGLSIVKQICDMAGYSITYSYYEARHEFKLNFNQS
jgi:signal transduction histidine kinase